MGIAASLWRFRFGTGTECLIDRRSIVPLANDGLYQNSSPTALRARGGFEGDPRVRDGRGLFGTTFHDRSTSEAGTAPFPEGRSTADDLRRGSRGTEVRGRSDRQLHIIGAATFAVCRGIDAGLRVTGLAHSGLRGRTEGVRNGGAVASLTDDSTALGSSPTALRAGIECTRYP